MDQTGYLWGPIPDLLPYLQEVHTIFRSEVNNDKFHQRGDQIFKARVLKNTFVGNIVLTAVLCYVQRSLFSTFQTCLRNSPVFDEVPSVAITILFKEPTSKMFNLRKDSWKKVTLEKKEKTSSVTFIVINAKR